MLIPVILAIIALNAPEQAVGLNTVKSADLKGVSVPQPAAPDAPVKPADKEGDDEVQKLVKEYGISVEEAKSFLVDSEYVESVTPVKITYNGGEKPIPAELSAEELSAATNKSARPGKGIGGKTGNLKPQLWKLLNVINAHFGKGVYVNSGYRDPKYNARVGGVPNSQHLYGKAADIHVPGIKPSVVQSYARSLHAGGVGSYSTFTHVDVGPVRYWTQGGD